MVFAVDIAAHPKSGPKGRTTLLVSMILFGLMTSISFPPSDPAAPPIASPMLSARSPGGSGLAALDGQKCNPRHDYLAPFLTAPPDPFRPTGFRTLVALGSTWALTPAMTGLTLPARVQADL